MFKLRVGWAWFMVAWAWELNEYQLRSYSVSLLYLIYENMHIHQGLRKMGSEGEWTSIRKW